MTLRKLGGINKTGISCRQWVPVSWHWWIPPAKGASALPETWLQWQIHMLSAQDAPWESSCLPRRGSRWPTVASCQMPASLVNVPLSLRRNQAEHRTGFGRQQGDESRQKQNWAMVNLVTRMAFAIPQIFIELCYGLLFSHVSSDQMLSYPPDPVNMHYLLVLQVGKQKQRC